MAEQGRQGRQLAAEAARCLSKIGVGDEDNSARMGIHTQFDARNPVHMRALSEAASGPTNNNVLASASYEL